MARLKPRPNKPQQVPSRLKPFEMTDGEQKKRPFRWWSERP